MESSFLSEGCNTSILRTGLSSATTILLTGYRPLGSCSRAAGWSAATLCSGPSATSGDVRYCAAIGGQADITECPAQRTGMSGANPNNSYRHRQAHGEGGGNRRRECEQQIF